MITLKDVSAKVVVSCIDRKLCKLLKDTGATSVEDVYELMKKYPEYDWYATWKNCLRVERLVNAANVKGYNPEKYIIKDYTDSSLLFQDNLHEGSILLLDNPIDYHTRYNGLKGKTIKCIKDDLAHTATDGKNYISVSNFEYRNIGSKNLPRIAEAVELYQDQIERQAQLTDSRDIDLFELNNDDKKDIVKDNYAEIVNYLVYNADARLIWGKLTDNQKRMYLSSTIYNKQQDKEIKSTIVSYVANYTTLPELENVANKDYKVLQRFIVK